MPAPTIRSAADPLDDIDRETSGVDSAMTRQDRADLPGERSDQPSGQEDVDDLQTESAPDIDDVTDGDPDVDLVRNSLEPLQAGQGADDDDSIDETERAGDDSIR